MPTNQPVPTNQPMATNQFMKMNSHKTTQGEISEHSKQKTPELPGIKTATDDAGQNWWSARNGPSNAFRILREDDFQHRNIQIPPSPHSDEDRKRHMQPSHLQAAVLVTLAGPGDPGCPDNPGWSWWPWLCLPKQQRNQEKQAWISCWTQARRMKDMLRLRVRRSGMQKALRSTNGRRAKLGVC